MHWLSSAHYSARMTAKSKSSARHIKTTNKDTFSCVADGAVCVMHGGSARQITRDGGLTAADWREAALGRQAVDDAERSAGAVPGHGPQRGAALRPGRRRNLPRQGWHAVAQAGGQPAQLPRARLLRLGATAQPRCQHQEQQQGQRHGQPARLHLAAAGGRRRRRRHYSKLKSTGRSDRRLAYADQQRACCFARTGSGLGRGVRVPCARANGGIYRRSLVTVASRATAASFALLTYVANWLRLRARRPRVWMEERLASQACEPPNVSHKRRVRNLLVGSVGLTLERQQTRSHDRDVLGQCGGHRDDRPILQGSGALSWRHTFAITRLHGPTHVQYELLSNPS
jgi:hypothetical protein